MKIEDTTATLFTRSTVKITAIFSGARVSSGTGVMIGPSTVLTAAHVIYDEDNLTQALAVNIVPACAGDYHPYGKTTAESLHIQKAYRENPVPCGPYDVAVINLKDKTIGKKTGYVSCKVRSASDLLAHLVELNGYPGSGYSIWNDVTVNGYMYGMGGSVTRVFSNRTLEHDCDMFSGMSGGGLLRYIDGEPSVIGVNVGAYQSANYFNIATTIDSERLAWINQVRK